MHLKLLIFLCRSQPHPKSAIKFELGGVLDSTLVGCTRIFQFNPSYAFLSELKDLLRKAFQYYPSEEIERLKMVRRRQSCTRKPL